MKNENQPSGDDIQVIWTIEQSMHDLYSYIMQFKFCKAQGRRKVWKYGRGQVALKGISMKKVLLAKWGRGGRKD